MFESRPAGYAEQIPTIVVDYIRTHTGETITTPPTFKSVFIIGTGWTTLPGIPISNQVTNGNARALRAHGVTAVAVAVTDDRTVDFGIAELTW